MVAELYFLDWRSQDTQPTPEEVSSVLASQGFVVVGTPKVYKNGDIQAECEPSPEGRAFDWHAPAIPIEDKLAGHIKRLMTAKALIERTPEHKRSPVEQGTLATIALLMFGYGIEPD